MKKIRDLFLTLSFNKKIYILVILVGIIPLGAVTALSYIELKKTSMEKQIYSVNKGYEQIYQSLSEQLTRAHNISTLIAVNDTINLTLKLDENDDISIVDQLSDFSAISSYTYAIEMSNACSNILYYINDSFIVVNDYGIRYRPLNSIINTEWAKLVTSNKGKPTWIKFEDSSAGGNHIESFALARILWDCDDYNRSLGFLVITLDMEHISNILIESLPDQIIYLETQEGEFITSNRESNLRLPAENIKKNNASFSTVKIGNQSYLANSTLIDSTNVYLISLIPESSISAIVSGSANKLLVTYGLILVVLMLVIFPITNSVLRRIRLLGRQMKEGGEGNIRTLDTDHYTDEIGLLITSYNNMVEKINELMKEQFEIGQEKIGAELKVLQSQINPHFLYNTLDMVSWMAYKGETENIVEVIQAMSRFYRLTLSSGADIITVLDETNMCEAYIEIQKKRFRGTIRFEVDIHQDVYNCLIPKITLQPFIENAIIHGISEKPEGRGIIILNGVLKDDRVVLSVMDDGMGMVEEDKCKSNTGGSHYGMKNIEKRLSLFYEEKIEIQVESSLGIGTCVSICLPVRRNIS